MELAVGIFERLLDSFDIFDDLHLLDKVDIEMVSIADKSENSLAGSLTVMHLELAILEPFSQA